MHNHFIKKRPPFEIINRIIQNKIAFYDFAQQKYSLTSYDSFLTLKQFVSEFMRAYPLTDDDLSIRDAGTLLLQELNRYNCLPLPQCQPDIMCCQLQAIFKYANTDSFILNFLPKEIVEMQTSISKESTQSEKQLDFYMTKGVDAIIQKSPVKVIKYDRFRSSSNILELDSLDEYDLELELYKSAHSFFNSSSQNRTTPSLPVEIEFLSEVETTTILSSPSF